MSNLKIDFRVLRADRRTTKSNEPYYVLELLDGSGNKHEARVWNDVIAGTGEDGLPQEGQYWGNVRSRENIFKGQRQLVIEDYSIYKDSVITPEIRDQFTEAPVVDVDRVIDRMFHWPFWETNMRILMECVKDHLNRDGVWDKIMAIPAGAAYHHNVRGGFLLHIDEMLDFSESLCNAAVFGQSIIDPQRDPRKDLFRVNGLKHYPGLIDYQILRAGIVLHDIGKIYDYDEKTLQFQANPISECLEHTIVGILMVERYWIKDSAEAVDRGLRLMHALAAHHGPEMGAVRPKTPEALMLHSIDMLSANLDVCRRAYADAKKTGSLPVEYSRMLGVRPFIPGFFPSTEAVFEKKNEPAKLDTQDTETVPEFSGKLPWEA